MAGQKKSFIHFSFADFLFIVLFLFSNIMLAFNSKSFVINFHKLGFSLLSSGQSAIHFIISKVDAITTDLIELKEMKEQNIVLKEKLQNYEYMQQANADIRRENERLKSLLDFSTTLVQKNYPAEIIGRDPDSLYAYLTINKGSKQGIRKNQPVIAIQNGATGIVGKIVSVGFNTSQILPVYSVHCSVSARVQNTRDLGLVEGNGNQDSPLLMKYIKKRAISDLHRGDVIVTSGENENYIPNVSIGTISKISTVDYDSSLIIELTPTIDFSKLEDVI
ncbi:MAG: rod shape-determining protein MreC, partial [Treponema sp.]|nr:rod shape-determining protein MreC [Treponema sp.]